MQSLRLRGLGSVAALAFVAALPSAAAAAPGDLALADQVALGNTPYDLVTGDFNGDGKVDAAAPNANGGNLTVLLGQGDGTFEPAAESPIATDGSPLGLAVGRLDGDADLDLALVQGAPETVRILLGDGDGTFTPAAAEPSVGLNPIAIAAAELSGDANTDLVVANQGDGTDPGNVTVLLGDGAGAFTEAAESPETVGLSPTDVVIGDLNGAGALDMATANIEGDNVSILPGAGGGDFSAATNVAAGDGPFALVAAKLDADADQDLAISNSFSEDTTILLNDGSGAFTQPDSSPEPEGGTDSIGAGDLDGDGDVDLLVTQGSDELAELLNNGSGNFAPAAGTPITKVHAFPTRIAVADTDNDSDLDVLVSGGNGGDYRLSSFVNDESDADSDHVADGFDQCPQVADPEGCPRIPRTISIAYAARTHVFRGAVVSGEPTCVGPGVKVRLIRSSPRSQTVVDRGRTDAAGKYRIKERARRGQYWANVKDRIDPALGRCAAANSQAIDP